MPERTSLRRKRLSLDRLSLEIGINYSLRFLHDIVLDTAKTSNTAVILTVSCVTPAQGLAKLAGSRIFCLRVKLSHLHFLSQL